VINKALVENVRDEESLIALLSIPEDRGGLGWPVDVEFAFDPIPQISESDAGNGKVRVSRLIPAGVSGERLIILAEFERPYRRRDLLKLLRDLRRLIRESGKFEEYTGLGDTIFIAVKPGYEDLRFVLFEERKNGLPKLRSFGWQQGRLGRTVLTHNLPQLTWNKRTLWSDAWNVEALTKEFFREISDRFYDTVDAVRPKFPSEDAARLVVQTLFNRLLFLRFVEEKGWLDYAGDKRYLQALWKASKSDTNPLWPTRLSALFQALNHPTSNEVHAVARPLIGEVHYLNGGLFEQTIDPQLPFPAAVFDALLGDDGLFYRYNFIAEESAPLDVEIAIDPEMLGKIFEQLTISTKRHDTGSYYTPREIVQFMCREALVGYLVGKGLVNEKARKLVYELDDSELTNPEGTLVFSALKEIKVVDPACGSGAYLLGMLQELYAIFDKLRRDDLKFSSDPAKEEHERKLWIIENNLYGVDLQAFATNTAMLRLWLTLLVEDTGQLPQPLPNLEYKIETGDALRGPSPSQPIDWSKTKRSEQSGFDFESVHETVKSLRRLREDYQTSHGPHKTKIKAELESKLGELRKKITGDSKKQPVKFDWRVEFFDVFLYDPLVRQPGFDVAVANPPYVRADAQSKDIEDNADRQEEINRWKAYRKSLKDSGNFETLHEKWDLYIPFLERAHKMLAPSGSMIFIISDSFNTAKYATKAHEYFVKNSTIERIDFCSEIPLFNAGVNNTILHFSRQQATERHVPTRVRRRGESPDDFEKLAEVLPSGNQHDLGSRVFRSDIGTVIINDNTVPLREICYISKGMVIHADERKAQGEFKAADLIQSSMDTSHPKRFFRGKDMARWCTPAPSFLEWGTDRAPSLFSRPTFAGLYEVPEKLISMDLAGGRPRVIFDDQQLFHNHSAWSFVPWHLLSGVQNASIRKTARYQGEQGRGAPRMAIIRELLEVKSREFSLKYVLGVMNSSPGARWMQAYRKNKMHIFPDDWREFPIPRASHEDQHAIADLVQKCLNAKASDPSADVSSLESELDARVAFLYFHRGERGTQLETREDGTQEDVPVPNTYAHWQALLASETSTAVAEVRKLLAIGHETNTFECKEILGDKTTKDLSGISCPDKVSIAICAMLNSNGGEILVGVDSKINVVGLAKDLARAGNLDAMILAIEGPLGKTLKPNPIGLVAIESVPIDGKVILRIRVKPNHEERYEFKEKIYVRRNAHSSPALSAGEAVLWWPKRKAGEV